MRFILPLVLLASALFAIPLKADDETASALRDFDFIVAVLRDDYAGFPDKTAGGKLAEFEALVKAHRSRIAANRGSFPDEVWQMLAWFKDGHLGMEQLATGEPAVPKSASGPSDAALAKQGRIVSIGGDLTKRESRPGQPFGIFETLDGTYKVAILPDPQKPHRFIGVILESSAASWSRGQVKFEIESDSKGGWRGTLRRRDHSESSGPVRFRFHGSYAYFDSIGSIWKRSWPAAEVDQDRAIESPEFFLRQLSPSTLWLRLPNFSQDNRARIEALLNDNRSLLERTPNLLIDLRGNSGGSDASYSELMRWIYTRPIYTIGAEFRASPQNAELYASNLRDPNFPVEYRPLLEKLIFEMRAKPAGTWIQLDPRPFSILVLPEIRPFPRRVGIIATGAGSSGDQFVLDARQSRKATTFGGATAGVIDFSNQLQIKTPSGRYIIKWPTSRSMRLPDQPLDNIGIPADLPIPDDADPIGFVQSWLERQVD